MNSIKLTSAQARTILYCALGDMPDIKLNPLLHNLRDAGFIVKTKVEEAEDSYKFWEAGVINGVCRSCSFVKKIYAGLQELKQELKKQSLQADAERMKSYYDEVKGCETFDGNLSQEE